MIVQQTLGIIHKEVNTDIMINITDTKGLIHYDYTTEIGNIHT